MAEFDDWSDEDTFLEVLDAQCDNQKTIAAPQGCSTEVSTKDLSVVDFPFPFEPYDIQNQLMAKIYEALHYGKIGIFESPTGTGKSMSMICGALKWLMDYEKEREAELIKLLEDIDKESKQPVDAQKATPSLSARHTEEPDWIANYTSRREEREALQKRQREREAILKREKKLLDLKKNLQTPKFTNYQQRGKRKRDDEENDPFSELMQTADDEVKENYEKEASKIDEEFLLNQMETGDGRRDEKSGDEDDDTEEVYVTKIYFCSRTHSQLSQFVGEVLKSPYSNKIRSVTLGSRQNMCINPAVSRLKSLTLINDKCKELQKNSSKQSSADDTSKRKRRGTSCPYYNATRISHLTDRALLQVKDIEDLVETGKKVKACPYYAARRSIPAAQLVVLPYNTLLHNSTRQASGIQLKDNIVIIDEAHNLLETISNIHSVEVHESQLVQTRSQLVQYRDKYKSRLLPINLLHVGQLIDVVSEFMSALNAQEGTKLMTVNDFLSACNLDNINFFALLRFCEKSQIARKLSGFIEKNSREKTSEAAASHDSNKTTKPAAKGISNLLSKIKQTGNPAVPNETESVVEVRREEAVVSHMNSPLYLIENLLQTLTNSDSDGRVILTKTTKSTAGVSSAEEMRSSKSSIRYLLLNPAIYFSKLVKECRSVVIAGGTMQPVSEFKEQLFQIGEVTPSRILEFSCGHVISSKNLLPIALSHDFKGNILDFTYQSRNTASTLQSLCSVLLEISKCVPGGVVCFLPSYQYESVVMNYLNKSGIYQSISANKKIFREPKKASMVEAILETYCKAIKTSGGALLFSVVGGKMSEGINFSDELGRCIVMVGLPYPNMYSPELKEKMNYLNKNMTTKSCSMLPGQVHYENLCMKAVNQSIGRAIRHRNDYACMLLLDQRYQRDSIIHKLPSWLKDHVRKMTSAQTAASSMKQFFVSHQ